jgi:hypothetical protein
MRYSISQDLTFVVLALIAALALISRHPFTAGFFFIIAVLFVTFEHQIYEYIKSA